MDTRLGTLLIGHTGDQENAHRTGCHDLALCAHGQRTSCPKPHDAQPMTGDHGKTMGPNRMTRVRPPFRAHEAMRDFGPNRVTPSRPLWEAPERAARRQRGAQGSAQERPPDALKPENPQLRCCLQVSVPSAFGNLGHATVVRVVDCPERSKCVWSCDPVGQPRWCTNHGKKT